MRLQILFVFPLLTSVGQASDLLSAIDPRKTTIQRILNAFTGAKVGTYNLPVQKKSDLAKAQKKLLEANPHIAAGTHYYLPKSRCDDPNAPEDLKELKLARQLNKAVAKIMKTLERQQK